MNREELQNKVINVLEKLKVNEEVTVKSRLRRDLGMDSLDEIEFLMEVEKDFSLVIPDDIALNWKTVEDVVDYLEPLFMVEKV